MSEEQIEQKESIKLIKNTKGYNWEIKIFSDKDELSLLDIEKLNVLNKEMEEKYGRRE